MAREYPLNRHPESVSAPPAVELQLLPQEPLPGRQRVSVQELPARYRTPRTTPRTTPRAVSSSSFSSLPSPLLPDCVLEIGLVKHTHNSEQAHRQSHEHHRQPTSD